MLKGSGKGTCTLADGTFTSDGVDEGSVLTISFVGYVTQEVTVGNRTTLDATLVSDQKLLNELVVVGYGEQKKVNVIGSVSQIDSDALENRPVMQIS
ncbi:carboxypeptidase-like regulatory domain-containing protein [Dyadobacter sp. OTU695]|uniref:carboxypeptidase-like regulatory domain-containing protein n=1 Tax=Dyadobacter sp. OTU695 TaxID=3043860 RepID=UPI00313E4DA1